MIKKLTLILCVLVLLVMPFSFFSSSENVHAEETTNNPFLTITKAQIYHSSGSIYVATKYSFDTIKKYTFVQDGLSNSLSYADIITKLTQLFDNTKINYIYHESTPYEIIVIDKMYSNRTEMNHDLGITGDEKDEPLPKEEGFWFTNYISNLNSYLSGGGKQTLIANLKVYLVSLFNIVNPQINEQELQFNFCYGTELKSITSNATEVFYDKIDKVYYHIYRDITEDTTIKLVQKVPNTPNWYGVIIGSTLGVVVIGVIVYFVVKHNKRRNNE